MHHTVLYYSEPQWRDTLLPSFLTCSSGTTTMTFLVQACLWNSTVLCGAYLTSLNKRLGIDKAPTFFFTVRSRCCGRDWAGDR